ncbi:MAG TPA: adenylate/guanylate cyclase domain-containing protein [Candidatus Binatia bacterium]|nr:adenylate/guanylate cyclase domain-containing protein [Candidatus Binatia bacterium]
MSCPGCGHELSANARFCDQCGARVAPACPSCGADVAPGSRYCIRCGVAVGPPGAGAARFTSPGRYTPRHLADKIRTTQSALEGERKQVTVLFADIKSSMEFMADRDPEEARAILDPVIERMMDAVHEYEGTVTQVMGDGIMALFGAPVAHEDHAIRAGHAALRMQETIGALSREVWQRDGARVQIRVGLHSGEVVVRSVSSDLAMDYLPVGSTTHLAARLEQLARPGRVLVTEAVVRLSEGCFSLVPLGSVPMKGLTTAVEVYELVGAERPRSRLQAAAARGLTPLAGRAAELAALRALVDRASRGEGQVVGLVGEPGVGKSRLALEVTRSLRQEGWYTLEMHATSFGRATSYRPSIELVRRWFRIEPRDDSRTIQQKVRERLVTMDPGRAELAPGLLALLDALPPDSAAAALDPRERQRLIGEALLQLALHGSRIQPIAIIAEDLQWVDSATQAVLDGVVEAMARERLLLLATYRPEYAHGWRSRPFYTTFRVEPLPAPGAEALLGTLIGSDPELAALRRVLVTRTAGNPFFLEESVRTLVETGVLAGARGAHRLAGTAADGHVPATVQAVLAARIDRLPPVDKRVLQAAAVIGKDVPVRLLEAIAGMAGDELPAALARLQAAELLYDSSPFPEREYAFKHALTHEVAYGTLLHERRRGLHARVAAAIEAMAEEALVDRLAHHAFQGGLWDRAVTHLRRAGASAMTRSAPREALAHFEQAREALAHLPATPETQGIAIDVRFDLRRALTALGELPATIGHLREAETLAEALADRSRLGQVLAYQGNYYWWVGQYEPGLDASHRALALAEDTGDFAVRVMAHFVLGQTYNSLGDFARALDHTQANIDALDGDLARQRFGMNGLPSVVARAHRIRALSELGRFGEAFATAEETLRLAEAVGHPYDLIVAHLALSEACLRQGEAARAVAPLERARDLQRSAQLRIWLPTIATSLGLAYALTGRIPAAVPLLEEAVEQAVEMKLMFNQAARLTWLAQAYLAAGQPHRASEAAERALGSALEQRERSNQTWAHWLLGEIAAGEAGIGRRTAEQQFALALEQATALGMRPVVAHCHLSLGRLLRRGHPPDKARAHFAAADALFAAMGMAPWLALVAAETRALARAG